MTKAELYEHVDNWAQSIGIDRKKYPTDMCEFVASKGISLRYCQFETHALRGLTIPSEQVIILSHWLNRQQRNFYCAHEYFHHDNHASIKPSFNCFDGSPKQIDNYLEWEANEGAAELLLPYKKLLPIIDFNMQALRTFSDLYAFRKDISRRFNVPDATVFYRFEHLRFEIEQYLGGTPLGQLKILSSSEQRAKGIYPPSINGLFGEEKQPPPKNELWKTKVFRFL